MALATTAFKYRHLRVVVALISRTLYNPNSLRKLETMLKFQSDDFDVTVLLILLSHFFIEPSIQDLSNMFCDLACFN